jgi:hypothetical protein
MNNLNVNLLLYAKYDHESASYCGTFDTLICSPKASKEFCASLFVTQLGNINNAVANDDINLIYYRISLGYVKDANGKLQNSKLRLKDIILPRKGLEDTIGKREAISVGKKLIYTGSYNLDIKTIFPGPGKYQMDVYGKSTNSYEDLEDLINHSENELELLALSPFEVIFS